MVRRSLLWAGRTAALLVGLLVLYALGAVAGALIPRNASWSEPTQGVQVFVRTNGVHADLVVPAQEAGIDWYPLLPADHIREPARAQGWIAIGWGQREFYLETQDWGDLTVRVAVRAMTGGDALMRVAHMSEPDPSSTDRPVRISPEAYRQMAAAMERTFVRDAEGAADVLRDTGYGANDVFYEAHGTYHAFRTSNQWTADMLATAGVTIGVWTPFEQGIMWRFRTSDD